MHFLLPRQPYFFMVLSFREDLSRQAYIKLSKEVREGSDINVGIPNPRGMRMTQNSGIVSSYNNLNFVRLIEVIRYISINGLLSLSQEMNTTYRYFGPISIYLHRYS